jgi:hypothetical protein
MPEQLRKQALLIELHILTHCGTRDNKDVLPPNSNLSVY